MGAGRTEFELKFTGSPGELAKLAQSRLFAALAPDGGAWERLTSTYFDTPDRMLFHCGLSLRLREEGAEFIQAIKIKSATPASRRELEVSTAGPPKFPAPTGDRMIDSCIQEVADALVPIASTSADRWSANVAYKGAVIELAVDLGQADSRDAEGRDFAAPLAEVELELISGGEAAVFELARLLVDNAPLRLAAGSKLDSALALQRPVTIVPKAGRAVLEADDTAGDALASMLNASATRLASLQALLVDLRRPEAIHQMRVGLRRLRATERLFRNTLCDREIGRLAAEAKRIAAVLGPARDWDVFIGQTLLTVRDSEYAPDALMQLKAKAEIRRAEAWAKAVEEIASADFTHFLLDLLAAGTLQSWRKSGGNALDQSISKFAPQVLNKALKKALKLAPESLATQDMAALHGLRIALKKLRYPAQLFKGAYAKTARKDYMAALSALQGALGAVNDAATAQHLADDAALEGGETLMRAAGFVAGYKVAEAQNAAKEIDATWNAFEKLKPFWRKA